MPTQTSENRNQKPKIQFEHGDFSPFREVKNHKLNSRSLVPNPDGTDEIVERFYIDGMPPLNWSDVMFRKRRTENGAQETQARGDISEVATG